MDKLPLILWSGGLDSTSLVWDHLSHGRSVDVAYITLSNNDGKAAREIKARTSMKRVFKEYPNARIRNDIEFKIPTIHTTGISSIQSYLWLWALNLIVNPDAHTHIELGYIRGDDFWHIGSKVIQLHSDIRDTFASDSDAVSLKFPLEWTTKTSIYDKYQTEFGRKLLKHVTWCESHKKSKECECNPCTNMRNMVPVYKPISKIIVSK